jgi:hypothetical protein
MYIDLKNKYWAPKNKNVQKRGLEYLGLTKKMVKDHLVLPIKKPRKILRILAKFSDF